MTGGRVISYVLTASLASTAGQAAALAMQPPAAQDAPPVFRSSVDIVSVAAVVRDRKGRFVPDLSRHDFTVVEGGESRPILDFRAETDGPVKLALLVDVSGSMRVGQKVVDARQAADHLFAALRPGDETAIFTFDTQLRQVHGFTSDREAVAAAFGSVEKPFGQTSLYDAVAATARAVATEGRRRHGLPQRSAVVVLTDGVDTRSRLTPERVSEIASAIDVPVYIVSVLVPIDDPQARAERIDSTAAGAGLRLLSQRTGGNVFTASAPAHASVAARQIISELRHQYVLAFEASTRPGWRPLEIRAKDGGLVVRARSGYTVGGGAPSAEPAGRRPRPAN